MAVAISAQSTQPVFESEIEQLLWDRLKVIMAQGLAIPSSKLSSDDRYSELVDGFDEETPEWRIIDELQSEFDFLKAIDSDWIGDRLSSLSLGEFTRELSSLSTFTDAIRYDSARVPIDILI